MTFPNIAICGRIGSGKSHAASIIAKHYPYVRMSFATPLKQVATAFGFDVTKKEEIDPFWNITPRTFLQKFGTQVCRNFLKSVIPEMASPWVQCLIRDIQDCPWPVVVDDLRFPDEAEALKSLGAIIISCGGERTSKHESESHRIEPDFYLPHMFSERDVLNIMHLAKGARSAPFGCEDH